MDITFFYAIHTLLFANFRKSIILVPFSNIFKNKQSLKETAPFAVVENYQPHNG
jgi:hypothetical protein